VVSQDLVDIVPVGLVDEPVGLVDEIVKPAGQVAFVVEAGVPVDALDRHYHVDPVGPALGVLVDPGQLDLQLLRGKGEGAQHAESPGPAHRRGHVPAVVKAKIGNSMPSRSQI